MLVRAVGAGRGQTAKGDGVSDAVRILIGDLNFHAYAPSLDAGLAMLPKEARDE